MSQNPFQDAESAAAEFLKGGVEGLKFIKPGHSHEITITDMRQAQVRDFDSGEPMTWNDGRPRMQLVVEGQLDEPTGISWTTDDAGATWTEKPLPDDDGMRALYVKGPSLPVAFRDAIRKAGVKGPEIGGRLKVTYTGKMPKQPGQKGKAANAYAAVYTPKAENQTAAALDMDNPFA